MQYQFLDAGDEKLIELSELPSNNVVSFALRTTGYDTEEDEVVQLTIVDLDGKELFSKTVKPQNREEWEAGEASGGIGPADVEDAPELYQFEEEISDLFEQAAIVVGQHMTFADNVIESSWVTLPEYKGFDIIEQFCLTHSTTDYRNEPATVATLEGIASYYGLEGDTSTTTGTAKLIGACYRKLAEEHAREREAKGAEYWERRERRLAEEAAKNESANTAVRIREKRLNQMNALLWVAGGLIFVSLIIQLYQRGGDISFMVVCGVAAAFSFIRAVVNFRK